MAVSTSNALKIQYVSTLGDTKTQNFSYANPSASVDNVKSLFDAMKSAGAYMASNPATLKGAAIVTTTTTDIDIS